MKKNNAAEYTYHPKRDPFNMIGPDGKRQFTLSKLCAIMDEPVPEKFKSISDDVQNNVIMRVREHYDDGFYVFLSDKATVPLYWARIFCNRGARVIFIEKGVYDGLGEDRDNYPFFPMDNMYEKCGKVFNYIKSLVDVKTVAVTGTCGKTTTMLMINQVLSKHFNVCINVRNNNSYLATANRIVKEITPDTEVYVQETGASSPGSVRKAALMLKPDIGIILNVFNHHINLYKTFETLFKDKTSYDDCISDDGFLIVNYDDNNLAKHSFKHKVISIGIDTDKDVDYRGINIQQNNQFLEFDVLQKTGLKTHIKVSLLGTHNVYNVLAAFALGVSMNLKEDVVARDLSGYKSRGIRQNYMTISGYRLLIDSYNLCEDSLKANLKTLREFKLEKGAKKIAVITAENKLGDNTEQVTYNVGKSLDLDGIDHVICVGKADESIEVMNYYGHARALCDGIRATGYKNAELITDPIDAVECIKKLISKGDMIMFKGVLYNDITPIMDIVFGTSFSMDYPYYVTRAKKIEDNNFCARKFEVFDALDITNIKLEDVSRVDIPNSICGVPVYRVSRGVFKDNDKIKSINLGESLVNVPSYAFRGCTNLEKMTMGDSVRVIGDHAFDGCANLKSIVIGKNVSHIGLKAFANCPKLKKIVMIGNPEYVGKKAFPQKKISLFKKILRKIKIK